MPTHIRLDCLRRRGVSEPGKDVSPGMQQRPASRLTLRPGQVCGTVSHEMRRTSVAVAGHPRGP